MLPLPVTLPLSSLSPSRAYSFDLSSSQPPTRAFLPPVQPDSRSFPSQPPPALLPAAFRLSFSLSVSLRVRVYALLGPLREPINLCTIL